MHEVALIETKLQNQQREMEHLKGVHEETLVDLRQQIERVQQERDHITHQLSERVEAVQKLSDERDQLATAIQEFRAVKLDLD